jgi:2,3-bisphosphoglycerate-independent phosphoglycerate mutase
MASRCVLLLLDGLGDRHQPELRGTPLQAAHTPNLDALAACGANGLFHADRLGIALSSPDAHMAMYGYRPEEKPARSILEALGFDVPFDDDEVLLCARFACGEVRDGRYVVCHREPAARPDEIAQLVAAVSTFETQGVRFRLVATGSARQLLILSGPVSPHVTDADTHRVDVPLAKVRPLVHAAGDARAEKTATALNAYLRWCCRQLSRHGVNRARAGSGLPPINMVITYFSGQRSQVTPFRELWGLRGLSITHKPVQWGLAGLIGLDVIKVRNTASPEDDIAERIAIAIENRDRYDFIHVHTMAPDDASHTKSPSAKKEVIEALDRGIGRSVNALVDDPETLLVVTSDHSTPSSGTLVHSGEPVPLLFVGEGIRRDRVTRFDEVECAWGALGMVRGQELMLMILDQIDRSMLRELRHTTEPRVFWDAGYEALEETTEGRDSPGEV